jgi:oligosaccharyltransferase complex subunit epsilon
MATTLGGVLTSLIDEYKKRTPQKLKIIDVFLTYIVLTGVIQFAYVALVGTFPFNSFLSGFISTIGSFVLTVSLRMQVNPANKFVGITEERAFADFLLCNFILHLVVANFMG